MTSTIKVDTIQDSGGNTIISSDGSGTITQTASIGSFSSTGIDDNASSTAITIDSSQRVGIGTSSPSSDLHIYDSGNNPKLILEGIFSGSPRGASISTSSNNLILDAGDTSFVSAGSSTIQFDINSTERMRIDSSGNLLVGKTSSNIATAGVELLPDRIYSTRDGSIPLYLNRLTSDGAIAEFRKDNATVGSIFSSGSIQCGIGDGSTAFLFADNIGAILPWQTNNTARDNGIDLGRTTTRFKNVYLSGNIYLGGTGSANALDDYEEGTWTASYGASGSDTGYYTKVGRLVTLHVVLVDSSQSFDTVTGLPFAVFQNASVTIGRILSFGSRDRSNLGANVTDSQINIYNENATSTTITSGGTARLDMTVTYMTNA